MINAINLQKLRNAEFLQFLSYVIDILEDNDPAVLKVVPQFQALQTQYAGCDTLFKLPPGSNLTDALAAADAKRDDILAGLSQLISGYCNHFDPDHKAATLLLDQNISKYGSKIYQLNYQAESSTIKSLVGDWETDPQLSAASTLLGLNSWKQELSNANNQFIALYTQRTQEYGAQPTDTLWAKRKEANAAYTNLVKYLEAHATLDTTNAYGKVFGELNALIDQYNTLLNGRRPEQENPES